MVFFFPNMKAFIYLSWVSLYAVLAALVRFFLTTTGFWLFRIALARRRAAWGNKWTQIMILTAVKYKQQIKKEHHTNQCGNYIWDFSVQNNKWSSPCAGPSCNCSCEWCASGCWGWRGSSCWWWSSHKSWQVCADLCNKKTYSNATTLKCSMFLILTVQCMLSDSRN